VARVVVEKPASFYPVFERRSPGERGTHYCPGCGHGLVAKYLAEAIDSLGVQDRTILISSVGCSVFSYYYFDVGNVQASHGRSPAVATGIKRARPQAVVTAIQGDGDLAAIGLAEIVHAANRGEPVTILFVNNAIYGMTGGQMAPTTLLGQKTTTTPQGRAASLTGSPLHMCELLDTLKTPARIERVALGDARQCVAARRAVREALRWQVEGRGFSFLEILSPCPVGWKMEAVEARRHVREVMTREFPLRLFRAQPAGELPARTPCGIEEARRQAVGEEAGGAAPAPPEIPAADVREPSFKLAGFGGQGMLSAGLILAEAGRRAGYQVSWLPSYGPEMRGGTAHCHVRLARHPIGSPIVDCPDVLVAMNGPSLARFGSQVRPGGLVVVNSSLMGRQEPLRQVEWLPVPAADEAELVGEPRSGSIVALAAAVARLGVLPRQALEAAVEMAFTDPTKRSRNLRALDAGWEAGAIARTCSEVPEPA
jgi:2-oxoisovalerate ferredoxin oxidoreductase beta subunit